MIISAREGNRCAWPPCCHEAASSDKVALRAGRGQTISVAAHGRRAAQKPFYYDKEFMPIEKALHPDTILDWAQNRPAALEHTPRRPGRLLVPGYGNVGEG